MQHHLYLLKNEASDTLTTYTYRFDDHTFSPANQVLTRLFRQMILAVESELTLLEAEYIDHQMVQLVGLKRAQEILALLGANKQNIVENKKENIVLSRSFRVPLTAEALHYFKRIQDLEELSAYRLCSDQTVKVEVYFAKEMKASFTGQEEERFLQLIADESLPIRVLS
ncbi:hypothetical protein BEP19_00760 [Ammoniphilus oxalaticus]|uniref:Uncharacterized protein n=1 Tax=Ammoniphilus oxalaticus TaxID=66863 RepID=A0A419SMR1_9BACL|nr:hypothetical protein [Ammoniphilus oxalaticus]RKD25509.1 hypothetical protein BEP19_00760 [Ammoniphilus oxalaticus]